MKRLCWQNFPYKGGHFDRKRLGDWFPLCMVTMFPFLYFTFSTRVKKGNFLKTKLTLTKIGK
jgi:hypothetical protein